jgi:chromosome segregation ATPase
MEINMEFEQIVKRLEWLDKQQRETKDSIASLNERLSSFEANVNVLSKQLKTFSKQMTDVVPAAKRIDQFETMVTKQRTDIMKVIDENEKNRTKNEKDSAKRTQSEISELNKVLTSLKSSMDVPEIKKQLKLRGDEIQRILNNIADLKSAVEDGKRSNEDVQRTMRAVDETRKNDLKRITDIQGELTALRKRIDESREKSAVNADNIRNIENRFTELIASEQERKQAQNIFLEQQSLAQVERDRAWKDWQEKFNAFTKEAEGMESQLQKLDEAVRSAKKAQETYVDLNTKLERRINEVTEMQRLAEDRLRQEWITFKADDQKRWTGHSLSSEESFRDMRKELQKNQEQVSALNDISQTLQDQMHQTTDTAEKQLQEMMNVIHEWMSSYQRIMGHGKKTKK